jgi:TolB protein
MEKIADTHSNSQSVPRFSGCPKSFTPDGERLVFVTQHRGALWIALWHPGGARIRLLGPGRDPCWGADSRHILYSTGDRLVRLNVDSHRQHTLIEGFGRLSEPSWTK